MKYRFRAWHKTTKTMLYEDRVGDVFSWLKEGQPIEIMQWTGLSDKNGKEIYEGDIVLQPDYSGKTTSRVIFAYGCFYAGFHGGSSTIKRPKLLSKRSVVVGNIYEKEKPV